MQYVIVVDTYNYSPQKEGESFVGVIVVLTKSNKTITIVEEKKTNLTISEFWKEVECFKHKYNTDKVVDV